MKTTTVILTFIALFSHVCSADVTKLINETQRISQDPQKMELVWWIPQDFWRMSFEQDPSMSEGQKKAFLEVLESYTVFVVVQSDIGIFGGFTHKSKDEIRENITLIVDGEEVEQVPYTRINQDASNFFIAMKPIMGQMLGELGKGMEFIVYPNKKDGEVILDPLSDSTLEFVSFGNEYKWRLPLGSLMPPALDPETGEEFPGNYRFSPFTGNELLVKE